jgi:D-lactate dehydrogenase
MNASLTSALRAIVGRRHVLTGSLGTYGFRTGYRTGHGAAEVVVRPGSLVELWRVVRVCVQAERIVIMQAANTGLTGGSTPDGSGYDRNVVVVSTMRLHGVRILLGGKQAVCLPGATLHELERALKPFNREPHSKIGSSCLGASVIGGICNNSGGALVQRGPAFTQLSVFARLNGSGELELVNHLGIRLGEDPEDVLERLENGEYASEDVEDRDAWGSDRHYAAHVRDIDAGTPARFNADSRCLFEASGSAGRLVVFAVRVDTFPTSPQSAVFYIGTNAPADLTTLRRHILSRFESLPVLGEYLHRGAFDIAASYGKDMFRAIEALGTERLPRLFAIKTWFDAWANRCGLPGLTDRLLQAASKNRPSNLPSRLLEYRDRFEHHLILKMTGLGVSEAREHLGTVFPTACGDFFECTAEEGEKALLHRFVTAGAAIRYRAVHTTKVEDIVALDVALPRNLQEWYSPLPPDLRTKVLHELYYGHFFCHVFHQDFLVAKGHDSSKLKADICSLLDQRGAEYPAEHNVGHLYVAKPPLATFYRTLDPCNQFNPGIGGTSRGRRWQERTSLASTEKTKGIAQYRGKIDGM